MTEKELRKLRRRDFLQLLLTQGKDMSAVQARLDETVEEVGQLREANDRLQEKLDEKDEQIETLISLVDSKDAAINDLLKEIEDIKASRKIELEEAGSIAAAALSLNEVFEAAQKAADQYLYNIRLMHDETGSAPEIQGTESEKDPEPDKAKASANDPVKRSLKPRAKTEETHHPTYRIRFFNKFPKRDSR